jgi:DNA replication protein DnaD
LNNIELIIQNDSNIYYPVVEEGITWETTRKGVPGILNFTVVKDGVLNFQEGNAVRLKVDGNNVFYGFVFKKERDKGNTIQVTAYDQLRYLKNKDTYVYTNKTASDVIKMIAADFKLNVGTIEDTGYIIASRVEDNKTLFDIIQNALDLTLQNRKKLYVLYDDFGKLTLKNVESMNLNLMIDDETAENYSYTSSIDGETYNKIKLSYENKETGKREIYISQDTSNINQWGVLQYFETIEETTNGKVKADALLSLYNRKTRNLTIKNAFGDVRVRGGSSIIINLNLGDVIVQNYMIVEKVKHTFKNNEHFMNLTLRGGDFIA